MSISAHIILESSFSRLTIPLAPSKRSWKAHGHSAPLHGRAIVCSSDVHESSSTKTSTSGQKDGTAQCKSTSSTSRREFVLKSSASGVGLLAALINFSGSRPDYLGVQKNSPQLALCPPSPACISTSEEFNDLTHYVPPWTYNPADGRGRKNPASKEKAMAELIDVLQKIKPDNFTPHIVTATEDYVYVEYESPLPVFKFVDDVEFWFPPGKGSIVEYRSASRVGQTDFDANRKRIKAIRQALQKKGWESVGF